MLYLVVVYHLKYTLFANMSCLIYFFLCYEAIKIPLLSYFTIVCYHDIMIDILLSFIFNDISTFMGSLMPNLSLKIWHYLTHSWRDKRVHSLPSGISPKGYVIARLEFELTFYDVAIHHVAIGL